MLTSGTRLGSYEILSQLGAGGMGEVYCAKDINLGRYVAIKVLPPAFSSDLERTARFRREAQVLAAVNHPHIATIHGLEEMNGSQFLIMELVDGETLDRRITRGPIPVDEALVIAKQIADALEAAHDKGIIHRDLKPSNIALTGDGRVKVLDFGLAKLMAADQTTSTSASMSPTITSPALVTRVGTLLRTAAYMSPEQAKGREADKRSDVWAFGCVLYEMLTGTRAFGGEDVAETLAAVIRGEPDWTALPPDLPPPVAVLLKRCLQKDRAGRAGDIAAALLLLNEPSLLGSLPTHSPAARARGRSVMIMLALLATAVAAVTSAVWWSLRTSLPPPVTTRFTLTLPEDQRLNATTHSIIAISPDGDKIAYSQIVICTCVSCQPPARHACA
jgi:eukaryotic-like serine/threonine-protein kinase